jgi:hypothetical protein
MVLSTKVNGQKRAYVKEKVYKSGKMVASTKATGKMTVLTVSVDLFIPTVIATMESG